jgi:hypothetical protein
MRNTSQQVHSDQESLHRALFVGLGPGGNTSVRIPQEHILDVVQAKKFTINKVFLERPKWIDYEYVF